MNIVYIRLLEEKMVIDLVEEYMKVSNIYLGFCKINDEMQNDLVLQEEIGCTVAMSEHDKNIRIKRYLSNVLVYGENRKKVCDLETAKQYDYSHKLLLVEYRGYKHLFALCDDDCVWINYKKIGLDMCENKNNMWQYLPELNDARLYKTVSKFQYYVINTYEAFLGFVDGFKCGIMPNREDNIPFYNMMKVALLNRFPGFFYENEGESWLSYRDEMGKIAEGSYEL